VGYIERVKEFFKKAPVHTLTIGQLVTCTCHGGVAIVVEIYDEDSPEKPSMNMAQIYWIKYPHEGVKERLWLHTIDRLYSFRGY